MTQLKSSPTTAQQPPPAAESVPRRPHAPQGDRTEPKQKQKFDKIIECRQLVKVYDGVTVVDEINLSIRRGEFVTLLGPSGCGKTTTLRMIAGFENPDSGKIFLDGADVTDLPPHLRDVNTVFQRYALFPHLNVYDNIAFGLKQKKIACGEVTKKNGKTKQLHRRYSKAEIAARVDRMLKLVNLEGYERRSVNTLSGGQQQRIAIARALVNEPRVLLLDEPLSALDLKMRKEMQLELKRMHTELGITFIFVTHDQEEALTMSDTIVVMKDGVIQQIGTPKKIYDEPANAFVANFIGESNILSGTMIEDFKVRFADRVFPCVDKGFGKNTPVDIVIRPEDIYLADVDNEKGMLRGEVVSSIFKGDYYALGVKAGDYEFDVQETNGWLVGQQVSLLIGPNDIHIMKKVRTINEFEAVALSENTIEMCGGTFEVSQTLERGQRLKASIAFDKIELTDDEQDGIIGANVTGYVYKGTYYQVQIYTDTDEDFYLDTAEEWDTGDRVGIRIKPEDIQIEILPDEDEDDNTGVSGEDEMPTQSAFEETADTITDAMTGTDSAEDTSR